MATRRAAAPLAATIAHAATPESQAENQAAGQVGNRAENLPAKAVAETIGAQIVGAAMLGVALLGAALLGADTPEAGMIAEVTAEMTGVARIARVPALAMSVTPCCTTS